MFLYESDTHAITGYMIVDRVASDEPHALWKEVSEQGSTQERFFEYFDGYKTGHAFKAAGAIRFSAPLSLDVIRSIEPGFRAPQAFLYLEKLPKLQDALLTRYLDASVFFTHEDLQATPFEPDKVAMFSRLVVEHIGSRYLDSGSKYAEMVVEIDRAALDGDGIFTMAKRILQIYYRGEFIGFVVVTVKHGGTLKTGPVILLDQYRDRSLGQQLRSFLHAAARRGGLRRYIARPT